MEALNSLYRQESNPGWHHPIDSSISEFNWTNNNWSSPSSKSSQDGDRGVQLSVATYYGPSMTCKGEPISEDGYSHNQLQSTWEPSNAPSESYYRSSEAFTQTEYPFSMPQKTATMTPRDTEKLPLLQTSFDQNESSFHSQRLSSVDGEPESAASSYTFPFSLVLPHHEDSKAAKILEPEFEMPPPTRKRKAAPGSRRRLEPAEPDSARAIYLEKNRQAATKCRNNQKMQQDRLVESARDQEMRNKMLKAEVDSLKADLRELMAVVGTHAKCPDARLHMYVQREADRLAYSSRSVSVDRTPIYSQSP